MSAVTIRQATIADHEAIVSVARLHPCTRDFTNHMFSGPAAYEKGWIQVAEVNGLVVGFTCRRDKVREPVTVLYFVGVLPAVKGTGLAWQLIERMMECSPHSTLDLNCSLANDRALSFYRAKGFVELGPALRGTGVKMRRDFGASAAS